MGQQANLRVRVLGVLAVDAEARWAGRPPADPDGNLATLVSRLRAVLGPEVIAGDRHGWRFVATAGRGRPGAGRAPGRRGRGAEAVAGR